MATLSETGVPWALQPSSGELGFERAAVEPALQFSGRVIGLSSPRRIAALNIINSSDDAQNETVILGATNNHADDRGY